MCALRVRGCSLHVFVNFFFYTRTTLVLLFYSFLFLLTQCVELLLQYGADVDGVNIQGATPLHKAAYNGRAQCCRVLLQRGAKVNAADAQGATALHKAALTG